VTDFSLHLAPNAPWLLLALASVALVALAAWAYTFGMPPLPGLVRRGLSFARALVLLVLAWLLAQPVIERALPASGRRVVVLVDHSASMSLPAARGGASRTDAAGRAAMDVEAALRGQAAVTIRGFSSALEPDSGHGGVSRQSTALGDALEALASESAERRPDAVVVVSDGLVNAGEDPVAAARALGVPVHTVHVGEPLGTDRAVSEVEAPREARAGEPTTVRVHVLSSEPRGTPIGVQLLADGHELGRTHVPAPGPGAEGVADLLVTPVQAGLAVWTARVDSLAGDAVRGNDAREAAVRVTPGKLGVLVVSGGLNWDLKFLRRAWANDSSLALDSRVREAQGWRALENGPDRAPIPADLHGRSVVVLDAIAPGEVSPAFDAALGGFVRSGGGLLLIGGTAPGLSRYAQGSLGRELAVARTAAGEREASPAPTAAADELLDWDDDPARGAAAWRSAAPLSAVQPLQSGGGDRVLLGTPGGGPPLVFTRRAGRGPVLLVNGTGFWRWGLSGNDPLAADRAQRLWRRVARWLAEPVQGEPLRVEPERALTPSGEPVRLFATLQDDAFRPVAGASIDGEATDGRGHRLALSFAPGEPGRYVATLPEPDAGRWQVSVHARSGPRDLGRARGEFAVDHWSLEMLRTEPDSSTLGAIARASGGLTTSASQAGHWAQGVRTRALLRPRTAQSRLWESPWLFGMLVAMLSAEWITRRRRGLP
jgi:hypothetical protein